MNLNDVLNGRSAHPQAPATGRCTRCNRTDALGWSPAGPACPSCAQAIYQANIHLASLDEPASLQPPMPAWAIRLLIKLVLLAVFSLIYMAR